MHDRDVARRRNSQPPPAFLSQAGDDTALVASSPVFFAICSSSAGVPVQIVRTCSVMASTGQFHQATRSSRSMSSSEYR